MNLLLILLPLSALIGVYFSMSGIWYEFLPVIMMISACIVSIGSKQLIKLVLVFNIVFIFYLAHSSYLVFAFSNHFWKYAPFVKALEIVLYCAIMYLTARLVIKKDTNNKIWPVKVRLGIIIFSLVAILIAVLYPMR